MMSEGFVDLAQEGASIGASLGVPMLPQTSARQDGALDKSGISEPTTDRSHVGLKRVALFCALQVVQMRTFLPWREITLKTRRG